MEQVISVASPLVKTPRLMQVSSLTDIEVTGLAERSWAVHLPIGDRDWSVGLVVGPSGSGKSTIARALWPGAYTTGSDWPEDRSVVDAFPAGMGIKDVTGLLTSVGLGSVPAWLRPYSTLSNGERFRADTARALAENPDLVVMDEFTSVVDRQVAKVTSHTVQKAVRRGGRKFIAVSCHYDIAEWLQPDWVYEVPTDTLTWGSVPPRPALELRVHAVPRSVWPLFAPHHYLSSSLNTSAKCFGGWIGEDLVAFTSYLHFPHARTRNIKLNHRLVVLPDYQGMGIGVRLNEWLGQHLHEQGFRLRCVITHPGLIHAYAASSRWRDVSPVSGQGRYTNGRNGRDDRHMDLRRMATRSFEYTAPVLIPGRC